MGLKTIFSSLKNWINNDIMSVKYLFCQCFSLLMDNGVSILILLYFGFKKYMKQFPKYVG